MKNIFIDIHCHLDALQDIENAVQKAEKERVGIILTDGVNVKTNRAALELSKKYASVRSSLGIYPIDALKMKDSEIDREIDFIRKNSNNISSIGEVGMDFKEDEHEHQRQKAIFIKFIRLSIEINKPLTVHSRKAEEECIRILEKEKAKKVIMHCFCGKWKLVERIINNGWFLTVPTSVIRAEQFQNIAEKVPIEQLFCETDSPFLHPQKRWPNEPALVLESYKKIAELKKMKLEDVAKKISDNYDSLFRG